MGLRFWEKLGGRSILKILGESSKRTGPDSLVAVKIIQASDENRSLNSLLVHEIKYMTSLRRISILLMLVVFKIKLVMLWQTICRLGSGPRVAIDLNVFDCNPVMNWVIQVLPTKTKTFVVCKTVRNRIDVNCWKNDILPRWMNL